MDGARHLRLCSEIESYLKSRKKSNRQLAKNIAEWIDSAMQQSEALHAKNGSRAGVNGTSDGNCDGEDLALGDDTDCVSAAEEGGYRGGDSSGDWGGGQGWPRRGREWWRGPGGGPEGGGV